MTDTEKIKWFERAVKFQLDGMIFLVMKLRKSDSAQWAIMDIPNSKILNSNLEWEDEPEKAKRDESFLIRTRFDLETAITMYEQYKMFSV